MPLLDSVTALANPYVQYIKIIALAAIVVAAGALYWYVSSLKSENQDLLKTVGDVSAKLKLERDGKELIIAQFNQYIQLNRDIADAVKKIKVQSDVYIQGVENENAPQGDESGIIHHTLAGMPLPKTNNVPRPTNSTASRVAPTTP